MVNSKCKCMDKYFEDTKDSTLPCVQCHATCLTCVNQSQNQCITCATSEHRVFNSATNTCDCINRYYLKSTDFSCQ